MTETLTSLWPTSPDKTSCTETTTERSRLVWTAAEFSTSRGIAWGDYNGDGRLDLAVGNSQGRPNYVYENNGDTWELVWTSAETSPTFAMAWLDYDADGDPDLVCGNAGAPNQIYRNDGNGQFTLAWTSVESEVTRGVAVHAW